MPFPVRSRPHSSRCSVRTPSSSGSASASPARAVLLGKLAGGMYAAWLPSVGISAPAPPMARALSGVNVSPPAADALSGMGVLLSGECREAIERGDDTKQSAISSDGKRLLPRGSTRTRASVSASASEVRRSPAKSAYLVRGMPRAEGGWRWQASLLLGVADHGSIHL